MAPIPPDVQRALTRGRKPMLKDAPKRRLCMRFERGDTYWYITNKNALSEQNTVTNPDRTGKPPHRIRNTYNFIRPIIEAKVSAATQRIPSYEITPSTTDPTTIAAASLSERVALYGYDQWRVRQASVKAVKLAVGGGGDSFTLPYFDPNVGPYQRVPDGTFVGQGEVKLLVLNGNQCYWEAGTPFEESRWYAIERASTIDDVKETPGFVDTITLAADAQSSDIPNDSEKSDNLVMKTEYFERPSPKYPDGRCLVMANGQTIVDYRLINPQATDVWGPYPLMDVDGTVLDEPILHRLRYTVDPDTDRDFGLTWQLVDFQRTIQDIYNKMLEWKNRTLNPQMISPVGGIVTARDDTPGAVVYFRPIGGFKPEWETPPPMPQALFDMLERTINDMRDVASDTNVDAGPNVANSTVQTELEADQNRWQSFLAECGEWHSRVMRHCLLLVARYYTEPRLLEIRGRDGWELVSDFQGAHLMGQVACRVNPGSLTPYTRQGIQNKLSWIAATFPGWLTPDAALAALDSGNYDRLTESYWLDVGRANTIIQKIMDGSVFSMPDRTETDPATGMSTTTPSFMPSDVDNLAVWKQVFGDWLKTDSYARLPPGLQEVGMLIWQGIDQLQIQRAQKQQMLQNDLAAQQGMANAAAPQEKGMPSLPGSTATPAPA